MQIQEKYLALILVASMHVYIKHLNENIVSLKEVAPIARSH